MFVRTDAHARHVFGSSPQLYERFRWELEDSFYVWQNASDELEESWRATQGGAGAEVQVWLLTPKTS